MSFKRPSRCNTKMSFFRTSTRGRCISSPLSKCANGSPIGELETSSSFFSSNTLTTELQKRPIFLALIPELPLSSPFWEVTSPINGTTGDDAAQIINYQRVNKKTDSTFVANEVIIAEDSVNVSGSGTLLSELVTTTGTINENDIIKRSIG